MQSIFGTHLELDPHYPNTFYVGDIASGTPLMKFCDNRLHAVVFSSKGSYALVHSISKSNSEKYGDPERVSEGSWGFLDIWMAPNFEIRLNYFETTFSNGDSYSLVTTSLKKHPISC